MRSNANASNGTITIKPLIARNRFDITEDYMEENRGQTTRFPIFARNVGTAASIVNRAVIPCTFWGSKQKRAGMLSWRHTPP
jgi:hypothetical protein